MRCIADRVEPFGQSGRASNAFLARGDPLNQAGGANGCRRGARASVGLAAEPQQPPTPHLGATSRSAHLGQPPCDSGACPAQRRAASSTTRWSRRAKDRSSTADRHQFGPTHAPPAAVAAFLPRERMCTPDPRRHISRAPPCGADLHRIRCGRVCGATDEDLCRPGRADEPTKHPARSCHAAGRREWPISRPSGARQQVGRERSRRRARGRTPAEEFRLATDRRTSPGF